MARPNTRLGNNDAQPCDCQWCVRCRGQSDRNRISTRKNDNATEFWGASFVADPNGNILARGSHEAEETLLVECDLNKIDVVRTHWPFLRDRRIDAYQNLVKRYIDE